MEISKINLVYFSATFTTKKVIQYIAEGFGNIPINNIDITQGITTPLQFSTNEIVIIGAPVYAGRIPKIAAEALKNITGQATPAIVVCVYGNRDYDDALLELKDIATINGFKVVSAGAFVAQHSIFPKIAQNRPNDEDKTLAISFGKQSFSKLQQNTAETLGDITVKGKYPYKEAKPIPLKPYGSRKCNECGACAKQCPVNAIDANKPRKTDKNRCISCGRCIAICPQHARHFGGLLYKLVARKFIKNFSAPKSVETFLN